MTVQFCPVSTGFSLIPPVSLLACKLVKAINPIGCLAFHVCLATNTQWRDGHKEQEPSVIPLVLPAPSPVNLPRAFLQMLLSWPVPWPLWTVSPELPSFLAHQGCLPVAETCRRWDCRRDLTDFLPTLQWFRFLQRFQDSSGRWHPALSCLLEWRSRKSSCH